VLSDVQVVELEDIYGGLQVEYSRIAAELNFTCTGCPDNCCDSYFLHHTYTEWAYLWRGLRQLSDADREALIERSRTWLERCEESLRKENRPQVMCPLNDNGLCRLYHHRLLVCRTHGVPAAMTRPDGKSLHFPGCFRCQELVKENGGRSEEVERTPYLRRLALLENALLHNKRHLYPKIRMTIAEMIVKGPPSLPTPHCER